jgi:DNA invertase Pin-like site-specific DNA recombinase
VRQSYEKTGKKLGVERQRAACRTFLRQREWIEARVFTENNRSAKGKVARPEFKAMVEAIRRREYDVVVAWEISRWTRNARDRLAPVEACRDAGVMVALWWAPTSTHHIGGAVWCSGFSARSQP